MASCKREEVAIDIARKLAKEKFDEKDALMTVSFRLDGSCRILGEASWRPASERSKLFISTLVGSDIAQKSGTNLVKCPEDDQLSVVDTYILDSTPLDTPADSSPREQFMPLEGKIDPPVVENEHPKHDLPNHDSEHDTSKGKSDMRSPVLAYLTRMRGAGHAVTPFPLWSVVLFSVIGSFLGIFVLSLLTFEALADVHIDGTSFLMISGSFGAQAVLLFAAPHSPLAQPWNAIFGNLIASSIGVTVSKTIGDIEVLAAPLAVCLSIGAMQVTGSLHPPAGASALIAVLSGPSVKGLGYYYALFPCALGSLVHVIIALIVNNLSNNLSRQYPANWQFWT